MRTASKLLRPVLVLFGGILVLYGFLGSLGFNPGGSVPLAQRIMSIALLPVGAAYCLSNKTIFSKKKIAVFCLLVRSFIPLLLLALFVSGAFSPGGTAIFLIATTLSLFALFDLVTYGKAAKEELQW